MTEEFLPFAKNLRSFAVARRYYGGVTLAREFKVKPGRKKCQFLMLCSQLSVLSCFYIYLLRLEALVILVMRILSTVLKLDKPFYTRNTNAYC